LLSLAGNRILGIPAIPARVEIETFPSLMIAGRKIGKIPVR
jgi:hypothetical protein